MRDGERHGGVLLDDQNGGALAANLPDAGQTDYSSNFFRSFCSGTVARTWNTASTNQLGKARYGHGASQASGVDQNCLCCFEKLATAYGTSRY
jgi:hypothetical protein